jgi:hypothetical protein
MEMYQEDHYPDKILAILSKTQTNAIIPSNEQVFPTLHTYLYF